MVNLHAHDQFSTFDGYGKAEDLVQLVLKLGHTSFATSNHGTTANWADHYSQCKKENIKPILGVESYFLPQFDSENKKRGTHLCLYAVNKKGFNNINKIMSSAERHKYYNAIVTYEELEKWNEGIICTSACIAGLIPKLLREKDNKQAYSEAKHFIEIFGDDFYFEIQPYKIDEDGTQERVNNKLIRLAKKLDVKCIPTSDSHYTRPKDFSTYLKMHEIAQHNYDIEATYKERYIPTEEELYNRFAQMHDSSFGTLKEATKFRNKCFDNLQEIEDKIDGCMLDKLQMKMPSLEIDDSTEQIKKDAIKGLKQRGRWNKEYWKRCKYELKVIDHHGYNDYFLMVADFVNWAKEQGIAVGPGRGSGCNSIACYALGITDVDSIKFDLDFSRFLRMDKKKMPDIDLDFETDRRAEVIDYIVKKYKGKAAQICSYGLYKVDNLLNDLAKVCGLNAYEKDLDAQDKQEINEIKAVIKKHVRASMDNDLINNERLLKSAKGKEINRKYDNILLHFSKLYSQVRFIGTHAAGVAVSGDSILNHCTVRKDKTGKIFTVHDLNDLDKVQVLKFDILGLKTMQGISEMRKLTNTDGFNDDLVFDKELMDKFGRGETEGVFQFESNTAKSILQNIECDCFEDVVAASSMNRPGPLSMGMPETYAENKYNVDEAKQSVYYEYTKETYGTLVYQEQIQRICVGLAGMTWEDADAVMKIMKSNASSLTLRRIEQESGGLMEKFIKGAVKNGVSKREAKDTFEKMMTYSFNKGHGTGYSLISVEEMFYKHYHPELFWYVKLKNLGKGKAVEQKTDTFEAAAVNDGSIVLLPHVNGSAEFSLTKFDGEQCIQKGLVNTKGVGLKVAQAIEKEKNDNGKFKSYPEFRERMEAAGHKIRVNVLAAFEKNGAVEFNKNRYLKRVEQYNSHLCMRGSK